MKGARICSGKSTLLVAIITFMCTLLEERDPDGVVRILVASHTNVAGTSFVLDTESDEMFKWTSKFCPLCVVDRILQGLLDNEFDSFARWTTPCTTDCIHVLILIGDTVRPRVGSLKKIAKPILKHVLHYSERASTAEVNKIPNGNSHFAKVPIVLVIIH